MRTQMLPGLIVSLTALVFPITGFCDGYKISREQIFATLKAGLVGTRFEKLDLGTEQVTVPTVVARGTPVLRLLQATVDGPANLVEARFGCEMALCTPFYVSFRAVEFPIDLRDVHVSWRNQNVTSRSRGRSNSKPLMRTGETAILTVNAGRLRVVAPVTCLEPGSIGEEIRVRLKGTSRVTSARVTSKGQVVGSPVKKGQPE